MKRVLMVQPSLNPPGGGNGVAVSMIEALKGRYQVTVLTWEIPRIESINRYYGTSMHHSDFELRLMPRWSRVLARHTPTPMWLLKDCYLLLRCRRLAAGFDLVISANNEVDVGPRGIQYIHYPKLSMRPEADLHWYHRIPFVIAAYRWVSLHITGFSVERMLRNLSLVNSDFIGARTRSQHGVQTVTLHPPVVADFPPVPWEQRENGFVCIGRIAPDKRLETIIEILSRIRGNGRMVHLHMIGTFDDDRYAPSIRASIEANRSWISFHENLSRPDMIELVARHRYGIHAMIEEHFGMAVAEMVRAGCIVFAPDSGGPVEILGGERNLLYGSVEDAAQKIQLTLDNPERQKVLLDGLATSRVRFSTGRFATEFRQLIERFESLPSHSSRR